MVRCCVAFVVEMYLVSLSKHEEPRWLIISCVSMRTLKVKYFLIALVSS